MNESSVEKIPSERINELMNKRDLDLSMLTRNNMPLHGALWAVIAYLDESAKELSNTKQGGE